MVHPGTPGENQAWRLSLGALQMLWNAKTTRFWALFGLKSHSKHIVTG